MFTSLINLNGSSAGLGVGAQGVCHLIKFTTEMLLPRDVANGKLPANDSIVFYDYDTHIGVSLTSENGTEIANERPIYNYRDLTEFLVGAYRSPAAPVIEEDEALDETLEAIREQALADLEENADDDDDSFIEDDEADEVDDMEDPDLDDLVDPDLDDEADSEEEEGEVITLTKPSAKVGTKKWKSEIKDMAAVLSEYFGEELTAEGLDVDVVIEALNVMFETESSVDVDTSGSLIDVLSEYVDFE